MPSGTVARSGGLGVMRQFIGMIGDDRTLDDLALSLVAPPLRAAGERCWPRPSAALERREAEKAQIAYANALAALGRGRRVRRRGALRHRRRRRSSASRGRRSGTVRCGRSPAVSRSGSRWTCCCAAATRCCCSTSRTTSSTCPASAGWRQRLRESPKSVLYVSHDRELLARTADRVVAVEGGSAWTHPGGFASWHEARADRHERLEELRRRWDEEHEKLRELVLMYKQKAAYNDGLASRYQAAQTRLRKFEEAGPPPLPPKDQSMRMNLRGGRTGKRAVICERPGAGEPDLPVRPGDLVRRPGRRAGRQRHRQVALPAAAGAPAAPRPNRTTSRSTARRWRTSRTPAWPGSAPGCGPGTSRRRTTGRNCSKDAGRDPLARRRPPVRHGPGGRDEGAATGTSWPRRAISGSARSPAGSRRGSWCCCWSCPGRPCCCSTSRRTTSTWRRPRRWRKGCRRFEGTVIAVTHDRWFTRSLRPVRAVPGRRRGGRDARAGLGRALALIDLRRYGTSAHGLVLGSAPEPSSSPWRSSSGALAWPARGFTGGGDGVWSEQPHGSPVDRAERGLRSPRPSNLIRVMPAQGGARRAVPLHDCMS